MAESSIHELWKPIPGYHGYEASNLGRIRSLDRTISVTGNHKTRNLKGRILKQNQDTNGYHIIRLGTSKTIKFAKAVMLAFIGPCPSGMEICHNNGNRADDRLENLRYDTRSANMIDRIQHDTHTRGERSAWSKLTQAQVKWIRSSDLNAMQIAVRLGISQKYVSHIRSRKRWTWLE